MVGKVIYIITVIILGAVAYIFYSYQEKSIIDEEQSFYKDESANITKLSAHGASFENNMADFQENEVDLNLKFDQIQPLSAPKSNNHKLDEIRQVLKDTRPKNIHDIDKKIESLLRDKKIPRSDKISGLLNLLEEFGIDTAKGEYLLDVLGSFRPIEIAGHLIDKFNTDSVSDSTKVRIMGVLADSYGIDPAKLSPEIAKFVAQQSIGIQDFFTAQIQNPTDGGIYRQAIKLYPSVSSVDEIGLLNESLIKHQDLIPIQESLNIRLESSVGNIDVQQHLLPELLNDVQKGTFGSNVKQGFNDRLFSVLKSPIADKLTNPQLAEYIQKQAPPQNSTNADFEAIHRYYSWVEAYAATENYGDKANFISNSIAPSASPIQQAAIALFADTDLLYQLKQNPAFQDNMTKAIEDPDLTPEAKGIIQDALQRLQEPMSTK